MVLIAKVNSATTVINWQSIKYVTTNAHTNASTNTLSQHLHIGIYKNTYIHV